MEPATASNIQEIATIKVTSQELSQSQPGFLNPFLVDVFEKALPVATKPKALACFNFSFK